MSVPGWKRSQSKTEYIKLLYELNIMVAEMTANGPKKYRTNIADYLVKDSIEALKYAQIANSVYVSKTMSNEDFALRRKMLQLSRGCIQNVATISYIYLEQQRKSGFLESEKAYKREERIAALTNEIIGKISAVIKSDNKYK